MVILKNIRKTNNTISAEYYPEGKEPKGFMKISLLSKEIEEHTQSGFMAPAHVFRELIRLAKADNIPKEKTLLWY